MNQTEKHVRLSSRWRLNETIPEPATELSAIYVFIYLSIYLSIHPLKLMIWLQYSTHKSNIYKSYLYKLMQATYFFRLVIYYTSLNFSIYRQHVFCVFIFICLVVYLLILMIWLQCLIEKVNIYKSRIFIGLYSNVFFFAY